MCNLYSQTKSQDAMRHVFDDMVEEDETFEDMVGIFPDYPAPVIRHRVADGAPAGWELTMARWGMPAPQVFLEGKRTDPGVTNIRNVESKHWKRGLGVQNRCLVPFTSFSEIDNRPGAPAIIRSGSRLALIGPWGFSRGYAQNGPRYAS